MFGPKPLDEYPALHVRYCTIAQQAIRSGRRRLLQTTVTIGSMELRPNIVTESPTDAPTDAPTTGAPTKTPTYAGQTWAPTAPPTMAPTAPTTAPTLSPTSSPTSAAPSVSPTTRSPTLSPTTVSPTTLSPTESPTATPTGTPPPLPAPPPPPPPIFYEWVSTEWSPCTAECAGGTQSRTAKCMETQGGVVIREAHQDLWSVLCPPPPGLSR